MDSKPRRQASNQNVMVDGIECNRKVEKTETGLDMGVTPVLKIRLT